MKLPSLLTIMVSAVALFASDKLGSFPSVASFCPLIHTSSPSFSTRTPIDRIDGQLFAKPNSKKKKTKSIANNNRNFETSEETVLPANLKRKVAAKRPPLGHVVPEETRTKGCKLLFIKSRHFFLEYNFRCLPWIILSLYSNPF